MLRSVLRLFTSPVSPTPVSQPASHADSTQTTETAEFPRLAALEESTVSQPSRSHRPKSTGNHRERVLSMKLCHARLCSPHRSQRLEKQGIETIGDLARCDPQQVASAFTATKKAARMIQQYRRAARLSASVPGLLPYDALLLVSIHRRSVRGLSMESPGQLHRDLERFAQSSRGQNQLRGRRLPSIRRIKKWIAQSEAARSPAMQIRVA